MAYGFDEQETFVRYDKQLNQWTIESNVSNHISRILKDPDAYTDVKTEEENGRVISIQATVVDQGFSVNPFPRKKRQLTEEQKEQARVRMKELHKKKNS